MYKIKTSTEPQGHSFLDDPKLLVDFFNLNKKDFLRAYSYISEEDYDATVREAFDIFRNMQKK